MAQKRDNRGRTGRHSARPDKPGAIDEPFVMTRRSWLESDALRSLSLAARKCLDRLELEHIAHGGKENGELIVTYDDFARFGIRRQSVRDALDETIDAKLMVVTEQGRGGNREYRTPSKYRLTYLPTFLGLKQIDPTDDWKNFTLPPRDIESGCETAPGTVGAKLHPKTPSA